MLSCALASAVITPTQTCGCACHVHVHAHGHMRERTMRLVVRTADCQGDCVRAVCNAGVFCRALLPGSRWGSGSDGRLVAANSTRLPLPAVPCFSLRLDDGIVDGGGPLDGGLRDSVEGGSRTCRRRVKGLSAAASAAVAPYVAFSLSIMSSMSMLRAGRTGVWVGGRLTAVCGCGTVRVRQ